MNNDDQVVIRPFSCDEQLTDIVALVSADLSEPYSIWTYRYFTANWPYLTFTAHIKDELVGAIICRLEMHREKTMRGYIGMLAVAAKYRGQGIAKQLVQAAIDKLMALNADEIVLETEISNIAAVKLYEKFGFTRDKRLMRYYLNGSDAYRLKLWL